MIWTPLQIILTDMNNAPVAKSLHPCMLTVFLGFKLGTRQPRLTSLQSSTQAMQCSLCSSLHVDVQVDACHSVIDTVPHCHCEASFFAVSDLRQVPNTCT